MSLLPRGSELGRFQISSVLGQGAMGVVYLARDPQIGRPVAIKTVVRPEAAGGGDASEARFLKEAHLAERVVPRSWRPDWGAVLARCVHISRAAGALW